MGIKKKKKVNGHNKPEMNGHEESAELHPSEEVAVLPAVRNPFKKENYDYQHFFTDDELKEKSQQLARACRDHAGIEDQKKSVMSDFKAKLDKISAEINHTSNHINSGFEMRYNTCDVEYAFDEGLKIYYHNGKKVGEEKMTPSDYQAKLDLIPDPVSEEE